MTAADGALPPVPGDSVIARRASAPGAQPAVSCAAVAMPDLCRVLAAAALAAGAGLPAQAPVPQPEALAAARTRSITLLLEQMLAQDGGDAARTVARLQEAGRAA